MHSNWLGGLKTISLFALIIVIVFSLLFYKEDRFKELFSLVGADRISVLYLNLLLNMNPDNASLRLALVRQHIDLGEYDMARINLEPLLAANSTAEIEAKLLELDINLRNYFLLAEDHPSRETKLITLQNSIIDLSKNGISVALLPEIIKLSLALDQPEVAANLYYRWSSVIHDPVKRAEILQASGQWYIASGLPNQAAEVFNEGYTLAENAAEAQQFALLAIQALKASNNNKLALKFIRRYRLQLPNDRQLLDEMISLYLADSKPEQAYQTGILRLKLDLNDPKQVKKQIERALAIGKIQSALVYAQHLVKIAPTDDEAHEILGRTAEWSATPELAMREWLWLARTRKDEASIINTIRLSHGQYYFNIAIEMLKQLSEMRELKSDEMNQLLSDYFEAGSFSDRINFLQSYLKKYPSNLQLWKVLANTQKNAGKITQAMSTWQYIGTHLNQQIEAVTHQAELMWKNGQTEKAFSTLLSNHDNAPTEEKQFWRIFGELSWELERFEHALSAYDTLWESGATDVLVAERLIQLTRDMDKAEESIAIGEVAYSRLNQPRWLLLAMDVANQAGLSNQLKRLIKIANDNEAQFQNLEMYWLMRAQLDTHGNKPKIAIKHYQQALKVNPASTTAKEGILWNLIEQNDKQLLQSYIKIWNRDALENPSMWGAYGLALVKVGQNKEALPWFERKSRTDPDDYLWLLTYADVLNKAGQADTAWRLRKYVLFNLRSRFKNNEDTSEKNIKDLLHPVYLALIRDMKGTNADVSILKKFLAKGYDDPAVRELLIAAYLSQENYSAARYWLLQNHISRQETPAWQRLTLALKENNLAVAKHILENENDKLSTFSKIETLKRLNRNQKALALTYELLDSHNEQSSLRIPLFYSRDELATKSSKQISAAIDYKSLGDINFTESRARFNAPYLNGILATDLKYTLLDTSSGSDVILPVNNETDLSAEFEHPLQGGTFQVKLGGNLREDKSLAYGGVKVSHSITNNLKANLRLGVNEISYETGALRALGKKDTILLGLSSQLTRQTFLHLDIDGHRYLTRQGSDLGKGYKLQGILGSSLLTGKQDWQVRLQGSWESNRLEQTIPSDLNGSLKASVTDVETLIARDFRTLGFGTTFRYGASDQGILRQPFILADMWAGWIWPSNVMGYNGRIALGTSLFGSDVLSAGAFYSNIQGGKTDQAFTGVGLQYSIRF